MEAMGSHKLREGIMPRLAITMVRALLAKPVSLLFTIAVACIAPQMAGLIIAKCGTCDQAALILLI